MAAAGRASSKMLHAFVRNSEGESDIIISFCFNGKRHHLHRPKAQPLSQTLQRISLTIAKSLQGPRIKNKKERMPSADSPRPPPPLVSLLKDNAETVPEGVLNVNAWTSDTLFIIGDQKYHVIVNNPRVIKLQVSDLVYEGSPLVPQVSLEFASIDYCKWSWLRIDKSASVQVGSHDLEMATMDSTYTPPSMESAQLVHEGVIYWPTGEDIDHHLLLQCTPFRSPVEGGNPVYYHTSRVRPQFSMKAIRRRQEHTAIPLSSSSELRVISYNILSEKYLGKDPDNLHPFYFYCNSFVMQSSYRYSLFIVELLGYHFDIACLQEVDEGYFNLSLLPIMKEVGYDGAYSRKTGQVAEGEAIIFRSSKFDLIQSSVIPLIPYLQSSTSCKDLYKSIQEAQPVVSNLIRKSSVLQVVILKAKDDNRYIIVGNTHLSSGPEESFIRLLQTITCSKIISDTLTEFERSLSPDAKVSVIFCGDLNSCPCTGGYQYLTEGFVSKSHVDWTSYQFEAIPSCGCKPSSDYRNAVDEELLRRMRDELLENDKEGEQEKDDQRDDHIPPPLQSSSSTFNGLDVRNDIPLLDACGPLAYTHYRGVFVSVLDYVLVSRDHFEIQKVIPMPSHEEVTENFALPSESFPSDHLPLICDLKWK